MDENKNPVVKPKPWWLACVWWARGATITIYPCIYSTEIPIPGVSFAHELIHFNQQKKAKSRFWWFFKYIFSWNFRKQVELEAFTSTIRYYVSHNQMTLVIKTWLANELSGSTYFFMMSQKEAKKWVDVMVATIRKAE